MPDYKSTDSPVALLVGGLAGLLPPHGQKFSKEDRAKWLEAMRLNLDLLYGDDDE